LKRTDSNDFRALVRSGCRVGERDEKPGIPFVIELGGLDGPNGCSIRVTELQHTFLAAFEPHSLARPLVNVVAREIVASPDRVREFASQIGKSDMQFILSVNGRSLSELVTSSTETATPTTAERNSVELEIRGRTSDESRGREASLSHTSQEAAFLLAEFIVGLLKPSLEADLDIEPEEFVEGLSELVKVNRYERDPRVRRECIAHFGPVCQICGFDFAERYGDLGRNFIEVHHIVPLSSGAGVEIVVDPTVDVVPICSNCHSMIHRGGHTRSLDDVRRALR